MHMNAILIFFCQRVSIPVLHALLTSHHMLLYHNYASNFPPLPNAAKMMPPLCPELFAGLQSGQIISTEAAFNPTWRHFSPFLWQSAVNNGLLMYRHGIKLGHSRLLCQWERSRGAHGWALSVYKHEARINQEPAGTGRGHKYTGLPRHSNAGSGCDADTK